MIGARETTEGGFFSPLQNIISRATAQRLSCLVVPGPELALASGLDLPAAGLALAAGPRQANVLLLVLPLSEKLLTAASIAYAQMPRPRMVLALGEGTFSPLPEADATGPLTSEGLMEATKKLRQIMAEGIFATKIDDYDAPALQTRIEYTCPMHPEVVSDEPGSCPKCGMFLVPKETSTTSDTPSPHDHATMAASRPAASVSSAEFAHTADDNVAKYVCPMHPEVTSDAPGNCPKCGMNLVKPDESEGHGHHTHSHSAHADSEKTAKYVCPMHPEVTSNEPGSCPKCGMFLEEVTKAGGEEQHDHSSHASGKEAAKYTCPMHPEVISDSPGQCPKCGMNLEQQTTDDEHDGHQSSGHDHGGNALLDGLIGLEPGFMSMIEMTDGTPRSSNGLQMEWITAPFGPFFPGLPGGLTLELELDGDTVVEAKTGSLTGLQDPLKNGPLAAADYVAALGVQMPLATIAYRLLACRAIEVAGNTFATPEIKAIRMATLARERIASHLSWLSQLGRQLGLKAVEREAATLHLLVHAADPATIQALEPRVKKLLSKLRRTWFLSRRLATVGALPASAAWDGPTSHDNTAAGRFTARLDEIATSLNEIKGASSLSAPTLADIGTATGEGHAEVQTPRGLASLHIKLESGKVVSATLKTPSMRHIKLVNPLIEQRELADALVAVASLDLSPWELNT
ncbi:MAG: hypothetical protein L3J37_06805 [Rhodobacteraceae bacterium]|nr:hypothetical protein [Paracoccaceae bacterium]